MKDRYSVKATVREGVEVFTLKEEGRGVAEVVPSLGNNCFSFRTDADVLEPVAFSEFLKKPTAYGIPILFPFPNRIRDGRFSFRGETYTVDPPRHGFVRDRPWEVTAHGASDEEGAWIVSSFDASNYAEEILRQFPFRFTLRFTYRLRDGCLEMRAAARNTGRREMPLGFGIHPYFRKPVVGSVSVPASKRWELEDSLPTGRIIPVEGEYDLRAGRSLEALTLDDIFTGIESERNRAARCVIADHESGTETLIEFSAAKFPHVVVYTPPAPRRAICVEPNTCPTDAFNLSERGVESDVIVLGADEEVRFQIHVSTRRRDKRSEL